MFHYVCMCVCVCVCVDTLIKLNYLRIYWGDWSQTLHEGSFCHPGLNTSPSYTSVTRTPRAGRNSISGFQPPLHLHACSSKYFSKTTYFWWTYLNQWTCGYLFMYAMSPLPHPRGSFGGKFKTFRNCLFNLNISNNIYVNLNCLICTIFYKSRAFIWHIVYVCGVHGS